MNNVFSSDIFLNHIIPNLPIHTKYILLFTCKSFYNEIRHYKIYGNVYEIEYHIAQCDNLKLYNWFQKLHYHLQITRIINHSLQIHKKINTNLFKVFNKRNITTKMLRSFIRYKFNEIVFNYIENNKCNKEINLCKVLKYSIKYNNLIIFDKVLPLINKKIKTRISIKTVSNYCNSKTLLILYYSCGYNNEKIFFKYLKPKYYKCAGIIHCAILGQNMNIIKYVFENDFTHSSYLFNFVLSFGNKEIINYVSNLRSWFINYECCIMLTKYNYNLVNNISNLYNKEIFKIAYPNFEDDEFTKFYLEYYYPSNTALISFCQHVHKKEHILYMKSLGYEIQKEIYVIILINNVDFFKLLLKLFPPISLDVEKFIIENIYTKNIKNNGDIIKYLITEGGFKYKVSLHMIYKNTEYSYNTKQYILNNL